MDFRVKNTRSIHTADVILWFAVTYVMCTYYIYFNVLLYTFHVSFQYRFRNVYCYPMTRINSI